MSLIFKDRVRQKISAVGTGALNLSDPIASYTAFGLANLGNNSFPYCIVNDLQYEVGIGSYTSAGDSGTPYGFLSRNLVLSNSNGNTSLINFSGSVADAFIANAAELSVLVSSQPVPNTFKLIKWTGAQYELIDPIENGTALGSSISSSVMFYNSSNTNFNADPKFKFYPGNTPQLYVDGVIQATAKAFVIPHPMKAHTKLHHGSLEGPEYGIYLRGSINLKHKTEIIFPDYFQALGHEDYTVQISSSSFLPVKVKKYKDKVQFCVIPCLKAITIDYLIIAGRKDIPFVLES